MFRERMLGLLLIIIVLFLRQVRGAGRFDIKIKNFLNPTNRVVDQSCCYPVSGQDCHPLTQCRLFATACAKQYQGSPTETDCVFGQYTSPVGQITGLKFALPTFEGFTEDRTYTLIVSIWQDDRTQASSHPPTNESPRRLVLQHVINGRATLEHPWSESSTNGSTSPNRATIDISHRMICNSGYFGASCNRECQSRDDDLGHWSCSPDGERQCLPGWSGSYCDEPICAPDCHSVNGFCKRPFECQCRSGWQGRSCDQCVPAIGCRLGTCNQPGECICPSGVGGILCDQDLQMCTTRQPCGPNAIRCDNAPVGSYTCTCARGWSGRHCLTRERNCLADSDCANGGTCLETGPTSGRVCACRSRFFGEFCELGGFDCADFPCHNGGTCYTETSGSARCVCPNSYTGDQCEMQVTSCHASNPCRNGAVCRDAPDGGVTCQCALGFSGRYCATNIDNCASRPCQHYATCHDLVDDFFCKCTPPYYGKTCEKRVSTTSRTTATTTAPANPPSPPVISESVSRCAQINPCKANQLCVEDSHSSNGYQCVCDSNECRDSSGGLVQALVVVCVVCSAFVCLVLIAIVIVWKRSNRRREEADRSQQQNMANTIESIQQTLENYTPGAPPGYAIGHQPCLDPLWCYDDPKSSAKKTGSVLSADQCQNSSKKLARTSSHCGTSNKTFETSPRCTVPCTSGKTNFNNSAATQASKTANKVLLKVSNLEVAAAKMKEERLNRTNDDLESSVIADSAPSPRDSCASHDSYQVGPDSTPQDRHVPTSPPPRRYTVRAPKPRRIIITNDQCPRAASNQTQLPVNETITSQASGDALPMGSPTSPTLDAILKRADATTKCELATIPPSSPALKLFERTLQRVREDGVSPALAV